MKTKSITLAQSGAYKIKIEAEPTNVSIGLSILSRFVTP